MVANAVLRMQNCSPPKHHLLPSHFHQLLQDHVPYRVVLNKCQAWEKDTVLVLVENTLVCVVIMVDSMLLMQKDVM